MSPRDVTPDDAELSALVTELATRGAEFRRIRATGASATIHRTGAWDSEIHVGSESDAGGSDTFVVRTGVNAAASDQPFRFIAP